MAFDGFVLNAVSSELNNKLIGGKLQKIYEPNANEILLSIYSGGIKYALCMNISSNFYSAYLTTNKKENPLNALNFCMVLRKHLMGYYIKEISTIGFERILIIEFSGKNENHEIVNKKIIAELMGKHSNIILVDSNNIIIDALRRFSIEENVANRNILPKYKYVFPLSDKKDISDYSTLEESLDVKYNFNENEQTLSNFFVKNFNGISKNLVEHAISSLKIDNVFNKPNYILVAKYLINLKDQVKNGNVQCVLYENDYVLTPCCDNSSNIENTLSINDLHINFFLDDYYAQKQLEQEFITYRNELLSFVSAKLKKISKKLSGIDEKIKECDQLDKYKLYGELITSFLYQIPNEHIASITLANYYDNNKLIDIPLDISLSPSDNAKRYFKKYHKLKNTYTVIQEQKLELEKEINYLQSVVYELQSANSVRDLDEVYGEIQNSFTKKANSKISSKALTQKQNNKLSSKTLAQKQINKYANKNDTNADSVNTDKNMVKPLNFSVDGFKVLVGKNNKQNDDLTFKIANKDDIWFHVKDFHGSHVILCTNSKTPSQETINQVAGIAAFYSKAQNSSNVPVDYTYVKYVKKPSKAKPRYGNLY